MTNESFAKNLKAYRLMADLTQDDLARRVGIKRSALSNYELGRTEPSIQLLCQFANALGVSLDELISEHTEYPNYIRMAQVTDEESLLLEVYRQAEPTYQTVAIDILRSHRRPDNA